MNGEVLQIEDLKFRRTVDEAYDMADEIITVIIGHAPEPVIMALSIVLGSAIMRGYGDDPDWGALEKAIMLTAKNHWRLCQDGK